MTYRQWRRRKLLRLWHRFYPWMHSPRGACPPTGGGHGGDGEYPTGGGSGGHIGGCSAARDPLHDIMGGGPV
jgi:hypothetical protein